MLGRGVRESCESRGLMYPFEQVVDHLQRADLTFCNLESPLTDRSVRFPRVNALIASPEMAPILKRVGFDVVSLANNHAVDAGRLGLRRSRELLADAGVTVVGAGPTQADAERGVVVAVNGLRVGFIAYSRFPYINFVRDPDRETVLRLHHEALGRTVPQLAERCDVLVASFHWGQEGSTEVTPRERALAHHAVNLGADLVVGHHAHVRGEIERYGGGLIAYCLGNFVFDESYGGNEGTILYCTLSPDGVDSYSTIPVVVVRGQAQIDESGAGES